MKRAEVGNPTFNRYRADPPPGPSSAAGGSGWWSPDVVYAIWIVGWILLCLWMWS